MRQSAARLVQVCTRRAFAAERVGDLEEALRLHLLAVEAAKTSEAAFSMMATHYNAGKLLCALGATAGPAGTAGSERGLEAVHHLQAHLRLVLELTLQDEPDPDLADGFEEGLQTLVDGDVDQLAQELEGGPAAGGARAVRGAGSQQSLSSSLYDDKGVAAGGSEMSLGGRYKRRRSSVGSTAEAAAAAVAAAMAEGDAGGSGGGRNMLQAAVARAAASAQLRLAQDTGVVGDDDMDMGGGNAMGLARGSTGGHSAGGLRPRLNSGGSGGAGEGSTTRSGSSAGTGSMATPRVMMPRGAEARAYNALAAAYKVAGDFDSAVDCLEEVLSRQAGEVMVDTLAETLEMMGAIFSQKGAPSDGIPYLDKAYKARLFMMQRGFGSRAALDKLRLLVASVRAEIKAKHCFSILAASAGALGPQHARSQLGKLLHMRLERSRHADVDAVSASAAQGDHNTAADTERHHFQHQHHRPALA
jgi:tetratricopeptide (TPR) repeat protein